MPPRYAARVDENQPDIVKRLRALPGCSVTSLAKLGRGGPDLLVGYAGENYLFEILNPESRYGRSKRPGSTDHNADSKGTGIRQRQWYEHWQGRVDLVASYEEILEIITLGRKMMPAVSG